MKNLSVLLERIRDRRERADVGGVFEVVLITFAIIAIIAIVAGIVSDVIQEVAEPDEGTVISTEYHPPYTTTTMQCRSYGSNGTCTGYYPVVQHHPERWEVIYEDSEGNRGDDNVSEDEFETIEVGDYYVND